MTPHQDAADPALARLCLDLGDTIEGHRKLREYPLITTQPGSRGHMLLAELQDRGYVTLARRSVSFSVPAVWRVTSTGVAAARHYAIRCARA